MNKPRMVFAFTLQEVLDEIEWFREKRIDADLDAKVEEINVLVNLAHKLALEAQERHE